MVEDKIEEETYSLIFTSLKHPIRRRILRMLADKPLTYSEILEILNIDSGHLSYHLENLGDLTVHSNNGQYQLSSFGKAAVKLMGGVEDQTPPKHKQKAKPIQILNKIYPIILALALISASLHLVNYTTRIETLSTSTASSNYWVYDIITFRLIKDQSFTISANIQYEQGLKDKIQFMGENDAWLFFIPELQNSLTGWDETTIWLETETKKVPSWLYFEPPEEISVKIDGDQTSNKEYNTTLFLRLPINETIMFNGSGFEFEISSPDGTIKREYYQKDINSLDINSFPSVTITQEGTYTFNITNPNNLGDQSGALTLNIQIVHFEKPYFYWGVAGAIIAAGYIVLVTFTKAESKNKSHK
ncbi:MAG: winged helix-turn-helix transcriptional regulator [Candidatus Bathyarchaeota archaeon]|nr:winged helix-turn-helix domain-containing protein [Candidatus Bathyarchaeum tardum]WGM88692.1 MAG: winged helix-turn-helix domain-containing protein [Candidatus Bathyarchaeum tardum]WNZ29051.1 MAG: winged helix-turn-helix transcriptional regulator [Candidatus Bathyarchaeota archaeon]